MSQITKKALAASLKKLMQNKTLDKITVVDITEDCGVNRQTFYYHFKDIYDLVEWVYLDETAKALDGKKTYDTWQEGYLHIFEYIQKNKAFVMNSYYSVSREHLERYLYQETYQLLIGVIEEKAAGIPVRDQDKAFIADFYKYAFVGLVFDWLKQGMKTEPAKIINQLSILIYGDIASALNKFRTDGHRSI